MMLRQVTGKVSLKNREETMSFSDEKYLDFCLIPIIWLFENVDKPFSI